MINIQRITIGFICILLLVIFWPTFQWMNVRFSAVDSFYAHGFLIPFVAGYLVYQQKERLKAAEFAPVGAGIIIVIAGLLLHFLAYYFEINFISGFCLIGVIAGLLLFNCGYAVTRLLSFALFFLVFMVPLPETMTIGITFRMKLLVADIAGRLAGLFIPLQQSASIIQLPNGVLTVGAPCSGLKSLITLMALSVLFAHISGFSLRKKTLFMVCAVPIALAANVARVILLIFVFYVYGARAALGWFHDLSGFLVFVFALIFLALLRKVFLSWPDRKTI